MPLHCERKRGREGEREQERERERGRAREGEQERESKRERERGRGEGETCGGVRGERGGRRPYRGRTALGPTPLDPSCPAKRASHQ
eukprot:2670174-Rhodomonas_salina.1